MDSVNVLCQMAEYDFSCPIDVTMIFEDSDDDMSHKDSSSNQRSESKCLKDNTSREVDCRTLDQLIINKINQKIINFNENSTQKEKPIHHALNGKKADKNMTYDNNIEKNGINQNKDGPIDKTNILDENQHAFDVRSVLRGVHESNREFLLHQGQMNDQHSITASDDDLLNKVSEYIVLIMRTFNHYGAKRASNDGDSGSREKIFHYIRSHVYELSFNIVETIILPQENNVTFINQFLDNTVEIANGKSNSWVCHRGHVRPFLWDLIRWTKQKRDYINKREQQPKSNENVILKQHLATPIGALNLPRAKSINQQNFSTPPTIQNNLCIFSSGVPGGEISINVNSNLLRSVNEKHFAGERKGNNYNNHSPQGEVTQRSIDQPQYENQYRYVQNNNSTPYNRPPPPYPHQNSKNFSQMPRKSYKENKSMRHNYNYKQQISPTTNSSNHLTPSHQTYQMLSQPIQNYQVHYIDSNQPSPSDHSLNSRLHINSAPMQEKEMNSVPIITNVISYAPKSRTSSEHCAMCGKTTSAPYNLPNRPIYCSYLCQELDNQFYHAPM